MARNPASSPARKLLFAAGIIILALAGLAISRQFRGAAPVEYKTATVKRGDLTATISATGTIEPLEVVDVGAQVAGLIQDFGKDRKGAVVDYGSSVKAGDVLAKIDDSVYAADLALANAQLEQDKAAELSAAANLEQAQARLVQADAEWKRGQELYASKLISATDHDTYKANFEIAKANVSVADSSIAQAKAAIIQAQAQLDKARRNLGFCTIKSPVDGVIIDRRVNIGQTVVASLNAPSLFLIARDLTKMQIWAAVNEADVGKIHPGIPVTFTCDTFPDREFQGTVSKVRLNATMTENVVMYTVEVDLDNSDKSLLPYLTANVRFATRSETNVLLVPNAALRWSPPGTGENSDSPKESTRAKKSEKSPDASVRNAGFIRQEPSQTADARQADTEAKPGKKPKEHPRHSAPRREGTVWVRNGENLRPISVKLGISDGTRTAVTSDDLAEGAEVVTGEALAGKSGSTKNPFLPVVTHHH